MGDSIKFLRTFFFKSLLLLISFVVVTPVAVAKDSDVAKEKAISKKEELKKWVVVVHADNPIDQITLTNLRRYLLKENIYWSKNFQVVPIIMDSSDPRFNDFTTLFLSFSQAQYPRFWIEQKFTRGLTRPKEGDVKTTLKLIGILKGGISVIPEKDWNHLERPSVKSVDIIFDEK